MEKTSSDALISQLNAGHFEAAMAMVRVYGTDIFQSVQTISPLEFFSNASYRFDVMGWILEHGADIDYSTPLGGGAIIHAIEDRAPRMVEYLLKKGANPNRVNIRGETPAAFLSEQIVFHLLHQTDQLTDEKAILRLLIEYNVDWTIKADLDSCPVCNLIDLASPLATQNYWDILEILSANLSVIARECREKVRAVMESFREQLQTKDV